MKSLEQDEQALEFVRRKAPYLTGKEIASRLKIDARGSARDEFFRECQELGIELRDAEATVEIPDFISHDLKVQRGVPKGFSINPWQRGTIVTLGCDIPGITRVTRHYAD